MSATGKSTLIQELGLRGYRVVDLDCPEYSHWVDVAAVADAPGTPVRPDQDWVWREDRVESLLNVESEQPLFVSGCSPNMGKFLPRFDHVVLLSAPNDVLVARLRSRSSGYGTSEPEIARVLSLRSDVEPLLRRASSLELSTAQGIERTLHALMRLVEEAG